MMTRLAGPIEQQRARTTGLLAEASAIAADHALRRDNRRMLPVVLVPANLRPAYVGAADGTRLRRLTRVEQHAGDECEMDVVPLLSR